MGRQVDGMPLPNKRSADERDGAAANREA